MVAVATAVVRLQRNSNAIKGWKCWLQQSQSTTDETKSPVETECVDDFSIQVLSVSCANIVALFG